MASVVVWLCQLVFTARQAAAYLSILHTPHAPLLHTQQTATAPRSSYLHSIRSFLRPAVRSVVRGVLDHCHLGHRFGDQRGVPYGHTVANDKHIGERAGERERRARLAHRKTYRLVDGSALADRVVRPAVLARRPTRAARLLVRAAHRIFVGAAAFPVLRVRRGADRSRVAGLPARPGRRRRRRGRSRATVRPAASRRVRPRAGRRRRSLARVAHLERARRRGCERPVAAAGGGDACRAAVLA